MIIYAACIGWRMKNKFDNDASIFEKKKEKAANDKSFKSKESESEEIEEEEEEEVRLHLFARPIVKFLDITGITARTSYPKYVVEQIADRKLDGLNRYRIIFAIVAFCFVMEYVSPLGLDFLDLGFFVLVTDLILLGVNSRQTEIVIVILGLMGFYINYKRSFNSSVKKPKHSYIMHLNKKFFSNKMHIQHLYFCFILVFLFAGIDRILSWFV